MHQNNADLIRPGCRGGHDQFNWESLRTMKYHDREQYLGQTTIIGYLDKGGKWRKKDWYIKPEDRNGLESNQLDDEFKRAKEEDERRIRIALGIEQPDEQKSMQVKLTKEEMAQLTKKSKIDFDDELNNEKKGLGNGPMKKQTKNTEAQYLLEAYGDQDKYQVQVKKEEDGCIEKKIKKEKKKKEKKEKKSKESKNKEEKKHKKHKDNDEKKERKQKK
ncbi:unnamed protein product (macronuclear) [Paramecium tetraurelia]|uniref:Multiple myeloma tumor-associated protein 2-like N-terminal domain-containing protein n=1 Tax=Paramecium tetraurelia TaxID=5888 RepID=A0BFX6_PARTE|nr:uncharacterized protein GSPATT00028478001 [Paramecium tetraurelia]CAK57443.1 unnamed protein product [Paramecium tetraurelia]|eukprot:XP_001424841.1 hypothetical protein (macronuclear) [Paramecium tetraurelia strain d4-2]